MDCGLHQQANEKSLAESASASTDAETRSANHKYGKIQFHAR
jgi:hypothetical protein